MKPTKHTILFIDDEIEMIETYRDLYEEHFEMITANSVTEGLKVLENRTISIVITDMRMPGMSGEDFMRIANEKYRRPIKIILSAYVQEFFNDQFQTQHRPYAIVRKPFTHQNQLLKILLEAANEYEFRYGPKEVPKETTQEEMTNYLNAQEILQRLRISKPTLYKYLKSGLPSKRLGKRRLFDWNEVRLWVDQQR